MAKKTPTEPVVETNRIVEILKALEAKNKDLRNDLQWMKGDGVVSDITSTSSGILSLDIALGIGGYPHGRIIEVYGPESAGKTTLTLHAIAAAQRAGGVALFIDAEHAHDCSYSAKVGVDVQNLLIDQPDSGEKALEMAVNMSQILTKGDIIVIDSVAALTPQAELDGEVGDAHVGLQARLMGQGLRKLTSSVSKSGVIVYFTNQIRYKIGVMFGCFHYDARVLLADGTTEKIGKIVNQKLPVEVLSMGINGGISAKRIINWHDNGKANKFIQVVVDYPHGNGRSNLPVGDDHVFITPTGEKKLSELSVGDDVLVRSTNYLTEKQVEYALGTILGDASLRVNDAGNTARLRVGHGLEQNSYCEYKKNLFPKDFIGAEGYTGGKFYWESVSSPQLVKFAKYKEGGAIRFVDQDVVKRLTLRGIALWYLDDGTFSGSFTRWGWGKSLIYATKIDEDSKKFIADRFVDLGLPRPSLVKQGFMFSGKANRVFQEKIVPYVPLCMSYKIHPALRLWCANAGDEVSSGDRQEVLIPAKIVDIYEKPIDRNTHKFDITVEEGHSYFVDNVLVHNSPETTSGGNALKFYASVRLDVRRKAQIKKGDDIIGNLTEIKVVKNKVAPPYKVAETEIRYGEGVPRALDILLCGMNCGVVEKSGAWLNYIEHRLGQGKDNAWEMLKTCPDIVAEIEKEVRAHYGI